ncbi:MAG: PP2C family protein-serine/threonine phosphatase [Nocardioides sp.]
MEEMLRREGWFLGALLAVLFILLADLATPESSIASSCAIAPFLASATCPTRRTAIVSAFALGVGLFLVSINDQDLLSNAIRVVVLLVASGMAPAVAHLREVRERRIQDLTRVARVAQDAVLTPVPPTSGALRLASAYESASREALIGGDLFAVVSSGSETRLLVGDVRGKGLGAVKTAAMALASFRESAHHFGTLNEVAAQCHESLKPHLGDEDFVTALFASIDDSGHAELVSYGHPPPVLAHRSTLRTLEMPNPGGPLGLAFDTEAPHPLRLQLEPGDRLLFFTDGLAEARDPNGDFLDVQELAAGVGDGDFDAALPTILARLHSAAPRIDDDLALLLVEYAVAGNDAAVVASGTFTSVPTAR